MQYRDGEHAATPEELAGHSNIDPNTRSMFLGADATADRYFESIGTEANTAKERDLPLQITHTTDIRNIPSRNANSVKMPQGMKE